MQHLNQHLTKYELKQVIGQGGMATVYLAEHKTLKKQVAIKVLDDSFVKSPNIRSRFLAEAKNMANMSHPNIIPVIDLIESQHIVAFVMEYSAGDTLKSYLESKGALPNDKITYILFQMLDALCYVHEKGYIHRDIKPSNFIISKDGVVKLLDFGIAKNIDSASLEYTQTGTNQMIGTPLYMSPEQIKSTKDVSILTDIYSLGVVLWEMVMGQKPYNTKTINTFDLQTKIVNEPLPLTKTVWDSIIQKATAKDTANRFKNMEDFGKAVKSINSKTNSEATTVIQNKGKIETEADSSKKKQDWASDALGNIIALIVLECVKYSYLNNIIDIPFLEKREVLFPITTTILLVRVLYDFNNYLIYKAKSPKTAEMIKFVSISSFVLPAIFVFGIIYGLMGTTRSALFKFENLSSVQIGFNCFVGLYALVFVGMLIEISASLFKIEEKGMIFFKIGGVLFFILAGNLIYKTIDHHFRMPRYELYEFVAALIMYSLLLLGFASAMDEDKTGNK